MKKQKKGFISNIKNKISMYDMMIACMLEKNAIVEPTEEMDNKTVITSFSSVASASKITKYYMITSFPDYIRSGFYENVRERSMSKGVKIDFYTYCTPHVINWDSHEMANRLRIWEDFSKNVNEGSVFNYRSTRKDINTRERVILSTKYLNEAELDNGRRLMSTFFIIKVTANRDKESILNMSESISNMKTYLMSEGIHSRELRINMLDWIRLISPFSLKFSRDMMKNVPRRILTDDVFADMHSFKQGKVGEHGVPIGMDIKSGEVVLHYFKEDPDEAANYLIGGETGSGKSYFIKPISSHLLAMGIYGMIIDYEGDEYTNFAAYIKAGNPDYVEVISMGKKSREYFDPCPIPDFTGNSEIDAELKKTCSDFILAMFRVMIKGYSGTFSSAEKKIMTTAVSRMYESFGVTDKPETWKKSKKARLHNVYNELKYIVQTKELVDPDEDNRKHNTASEMLEAASIFFEKGEVYGDTFSKPIDSDRVLKSKLLVFSFGMKGMQNSLSDDTLLALKQINIAYIKTLRANYCKFVLGVNNYTIWEEFQRWSELNGSSESVVNSITGGRKRGDINFIITNKVSTLLDMENDLGRTLRDNIQGYFIGKIPSETTRAKFCKEFGLMEMKDVFDKIGTAKGKSKTANNGNRSGSKYVHAFCAILPDGSKPVVKAAIPLGVAKSKIFQVGDVVR